MKKKNEKKKSIFQPKFKLFILFAKSIPIYITKMKKKKGGVKKLYFNLNSSFHPLCKKYTNLYNKIEINRKIIFFSKIVLKIAIKLLYYEPHNPKGGSKGVPLFSLYIFKKFNFSFFFNFSEILREIEIRLKQERVSFVAL